jgi:hypothetical protein
MLTNAFIVVGVATEVGIDPTVRHGADPGYIPVIVTDACGAGNEEAAKRSIEGLEFTGDAVETNTETVCATVRRRPAFGPEVQRSSSIICFASFGPMPLSSCLK